MLPLFLLCSLATTLQATTLVRFDLEGLTRNAACVFVGTCKEAQAQEIAGQPYTRLLFEVGEVVKGQAGAQLEISLPGGERQGVRVHLAGMPQFVPGEEVVLFLTEADRLGHPWPVGLGQGKFRVQRKGAAKPTVFQDLGEAHLYGTQGASLNGVPLEDFLSQVRHLAEMQAGDEKR